MNAAQAKLLATKSGWQVHQYDGSARFDWSMSFHKPDVAAIWVRFSPTGILTKVEATDFTTGLHRSPARDKGTRLSHYLIEGIN